MKNNRSGSVKVIVLSIILLVAICIAVIYAMQKNASTGTIFTSRDTRPYVAVIGKSDVFICINRDQRYTSFIKHR